MSKEDQAVDLYQRNYNCSQAVFVPFVPSEVLAEKDALKLATAFGGGTCGCGTATCGAAQGALLAISLRHGMADPADTEDKASTYARGRALLEKFSAAMGGRTCEEILGVNVSSQAYKDDPQRAQQLRAERCVKAVATAARIADELI